MCGRFSVLLLFSSLLLTFVSGRALAASEHLIPLAALHFNDPAPRSETALMDEATFSKRLAELEAETDAVRDAYAATLDGALREAFDDAQEAWALYVQRMSASLSGYLDETVKVFYGQLERERITNIYRDSVLAVYTQRVTDLRRWAREGAGPSQLKPQEDGTDAAAINDAASRVLYVMEERHRAAEYEAQRAWRSFYKKQDVFFTALRGAEPEALLNERALMVRRMNDHLRLQEQGGIFFHREREE